MKILITGANGLIGHELTKILCGNPEYFIYGVGRGKPQFENVNYLHIQADFHDSAFIEQLPEDITHIFHLAQSEKFREFPAQAVEVFNVNTVSTLKLLDFSIKRKVKKFVLASSGGVYGNKDIGFTEDTPVMGSGDLGFYLSSKLCSEIIADNYSGIFDVIQLRFFFVYGERQNPSMLIPRLINSVLKSISIPLSGQNGISINPVYVKDAALAAANALLLPHSDKINIGGDENVSIRRIAEMIGDLCGIKPFFSESSAKAENLIGDIAKMKRLLHEPATSLRSGIELAILNYR